MVDTLVVAFLCLFCSSLLNLRYQSIGIKIFTVKSSITARIATRIGNHPRFTNHAIIGFMAVSIHPNVRLVLPDNLFHGQGGICRINLTFSVIVIFGWDWHMMGDHDAWPAERLVEPIQER